MKDGTVTQRPDSFEVFNRHHIDDRTVLIVEPNPYHGEILPSFVKYFQDIGYSVDIFIRSELALENPFVRYSDNRMPNIFSWSVDQMKRVLSTKKIEEYDYVFFSTNVLWDSKYFVGSYISYLGFVPQAKFGSIFVEHNPALLEKDNGKYLAEQGRVFSLMDQGLKNDSVPMLNPHYFGETSIGAKKSNIAHFSVVGALDPDSKNVSLLLSVIRKLSEENIKNFHISLIGNGTVEIPAELQSFITQCGRLDFLEMYKRVESSDFLLPLLDSQNEKHGRYLNGTTSGIVQLSLGFLKPMIIDGAFSSHYGFDDTNCLSYDAADNFVRQMKSAVSMDQKKYSDIQNSIKEKAQDIALKSSDNLDTVLKNLQTVPRKFKCLVEDAELSIEERERELVLFKKMIDQRNCDISRLDAEIKMIKSSKFWYLRNKYIYIKNLILERP